MRELGDTLSGLDVICGREASKIIQNGEWLDNANAFHRGVMIALTDAGFKVFFEFSTAPLGDDVYGRIDIVAEKYGGSVAIELDNRRPRKRSIRKLRLFSGYRIIALRGVEIKDCPDEIDETITAKVFI